MSVFLLYHFHSIYRNWAVLLFFDRRTGAAPESRVFFLLPKKFFQKTPSANLTGNRNYAKMYSISTKTSYNAYVVSISLGSVDTNPQFINIKPSVGKQFLPFCMLLRVFLCHRQRCLLVAVFLFSAIPNYKKRGEAYVHYTDRRIQPALPSIPPPPPAYRVTECVFGIAFFVNYPTRTLMKKLALTIQGIQSEHRLLSGKISSFRFFTEEISYVCIHRGHH